MKKIFKWMPGSGNRVFLIVLVLSLLFALMALVELMFGIDTPGKPEYLPILAIFIPAVIAAYFFMAATHKLIEIIDNHTKN